MTERKIVTRGELAGGEEPRRRPAFTERVATATMSENRLDRSFKTS
jgi:hypothetical protein